LYAAGVGDRRQSGLVEVRPRRSSHLPDAAAGVFATADGHVALAAGTQGLYERLCAALERPDLLEDDRFADPIRRLAHRDALEEELGKVFARADAAAWVERLNAAGIPCGSVKDMAGVWSDPHTRACGMLAEAPGRDDDRPHRALGPAVKLSASPWRTDPVPPRQGEHSVALLVEAGYTPEEARALAAAGVVEQAEAGGGR